MRKTKILKGWALKLLETSLKRSVQTIAHYTILFYDETTFYKAFSQAFR